MDAGVNRLTISAPSRRIDGFCYLRDVVAGKRWPVVPMDERLVFRTDRREQFIVGNKRFHPLGYPAELTQT